MQGITESRVEYPGAHARAQLLRSGQLGVDRNPNNYGNAPDGAECDCDGDIVSMHRQNA